jgi:uncharacterized membrane protein YhaH (DUF805 family)
MKYYLAVLKKYAEFKGRAPRAEYWWFFLFNFIFGLALSIIDSIIGTQVTLNLGWGGKLMTGVLNMIYMLAVLIPGIAVSVRRLHDIGKSGWMCLIALIPFIGPIWLIVLLATDGNSGDNKYGPNPKQPMSVLEQPKM